MSRLHFFVFVGLVVLVAACGQAKPTPLFLPTSTSLSTTPIAVPTVTSKPTATPQPSPLASAAGASELPTLTAPPIPTVPEVEPTREPSQSGGEVFPPTIALEPVLTGFQAPVYLTHAGPRLFVVEKAGRVLGVENHQVQTVPFLDITDRVGSSASEQGLLSVAFPPDFDTSQVFFVYYTDQHGDTVVASYRLLDGEPLQGDPSSEQRILEIAQPAGNHNGGQIQFGPDGYLYVGTGDGGQAGDPWGNAQNPGVLLGKILRIDVAGGETYAIPDDNPFVGWPDVRPEIWGLGMRNPWRFSFDRVTGDLYIADVGQDRYEEVHVQPANSAGGENYGWDIVEGAHCFEPPNNCESNGLILPVTEYDHSLGCSITGGYVYRGRRYPPMVGVYFFGDFCSGRIWGLRRTPSGDWETTLLLETDTNISSFGQDAAGELYVLDYGGGTIYHLTATP
jgi:glucose/arabinose dehydrogenase